jgi:hypothetical protein
LHEALLRLDGHDTKGCHNGNEVARQKWLEGRKHIRGEIRARRPFFIAITGEFTKGAHERPADMSGFAYYLVKPAAALVEKARNPE